MESPGGAGTRDGPAGAGHASAGRLRQIKDTTRDDAMLPVGADGPPAVRAREGVMRLIMSGRGLRGRITAVCLLVVGAALAPSSAGAVETVVFRDDGRAR